jgi:hypothetical protein
MAQIGATRSSRGRRTICLPIAEDAYARIINDSREFRRTLDDAFRQAPELFPDDFAFGYQIKDGRQSAKPHVRIRRIVLRDGTAYSIRPSFLMPYLTARTDDVEDPLFLRKFGVPFWALARVFGRDPMYWYRLEGSLGRARIVGTTAQVDRPEHLAADEHHQTRDGAKGTKFINCRIWLSWHAVWLVIWANRERIFQLSAGIRDDYPVSSAGGRCDALHLFHSERTPTAAVCRIGGPQTRTWRHCLHRSTPRLSSTDHRTRPE